MTLLLTTSVMVILMAEPGPKTITPPDKTKAAAKLADEAKAKSREAAELYVKAAEQHWHPPYVFAAAQAYENAGDSQKAVEQYTRYVTQTGAPNRDLLARANEAIRRLSPKPDAGP